MGKTLTSCLWKGQSAPLLKRGAVGLWVASLGLSPWIVGCGSDQEAAPDTAETHNDDVADGHEDEGMGGASDVDPPSSAGGAGGESGVPTGGVAASAATGPAEQDSGAGAPETGMPMDSQESAWTYAPCDSGERIGWFALVGRPADDVRSEPSVEVTGFVRDRVRPAEADTILAEDGDCRLVSGPDLLCDPRCEPDEVCSAEGSCEAAPESRDLGPITVRGTDPALGLVPNSGNNYLLAMGTEVAYPPYEVGSALSLQAEAFSLRGYGVDALALADVEPVLEAGMPLSLRWQAPEHPAESVRMFIEIDIAHHGGVDAQLVCHAPDTGAFEVPAALVTELLAQGVAGFPAVTLARRSVDSLAIEGGCVEFVVASEISRAVTIPGLTSCSSDNECPEEQLCQPSTMICE